MLKVTIVHFQPLEYFPPALNFIRYLNSRDKFQVSVTMTRQEGRRRYVGISGDAKVNAIDLTKSQGKNRLRRSLGYFRFIFATVWQMLKDRPKMVVYFDPYSSWPAIIYRLFIDRRSALWIHFHEYFSPQWYKQGMLMARAAHAIEKRFVFNLAAGISHTNAERVRLFLQDHPRVDSSKMFVFPNYPPASWGLHQRRLDGWQVPTRFVALGSFSLQDTYVGEFCDWVDRQAGTVELDIYALRLDEETEFFLSGVKSPWIRFHDGGVSYDEIPQLFKERGFHVGLVLYRCNHINTVYCVSNKVFEYLVCGLDVWYPREMIGTAPFETRGIYPKVLPVDFSRLDELDLQLIKSRAGYRYVRPEYTCEPVYSEWAAKLLAAI